MSRPQCPRARSDTTSCAQNDGDCATLNDKTCVGYGATPDVYRPVTAPREGWSAEPWTYDEAASSVLDANGHRIASLSRENAAMRAMIERIGAWWADEAKLSANEIGILDGDLKELRTALRADGGTLERAAAAEGASGG